MTAELAQKIEAGRETDILIAERIFGWSDFWRVGFFDPMGYPPHEQRMGVDGERAPVPHYSTDISAAWEVVEKLADSPMSNLSFGCWHTPMLSSVLRGWVVAFKRSVHPPTLVDEDNYFGTARTLPLAICRAALKAVEGE